jgi:glutamate:GABA antiporter
MAFILQAIIFFIYQPGEFDRGYAGAVVGGVLLTIIAGELLIRRRKSGADGAIEASANV